MSELLNIFKQTKANRETELRIADLHKAGKVKVPMYLSIGTDHLPPSIMAAGIDFIVFPQHRCHSWFLTLGGSEDSLIAELTGSGGGMVGSASLNIPGKMYGHSGLLGDSLAIAAGFAQASGKSTLSVLGDGACEEDCVLSVLGYIADQKIPLLIVVENNGLSILTKVSERRNWSIVDVARSFGLPAESIPDEPLLICEKVKALKLPALLEINVCRCCWHAGSGTDGEPAWNRYEEMRNLFENYSQHLYMT